MSSTVKKTDYDAILWDYQIDNTSLTIVFPNGTTALTTTSAYHVSHFNPPSDDSLLDYYLQDYAKTILKTSRRPQERLPLVQWQRISKET